MPREDDYKTAIKLAVELLKNETFQDLMQKSGYSTNGDKTFHIPFLNHIYNLSFPDFSFSYAKNYGQKAIPLQEQVLILHYLAAKEIHPKTDQWVAYREIPGAVFYNSVFIKRAVEPLKSVFGENIELYTKIAKQLGGQEINQGDVGMEFVVFPKLSVRMLIWLGDHEFSAEANLLFSKNIIGVLSSEDIAWLAGMLVYRLISLSKL